MEYLNFSWLLEGALAGAEGPKSRRDLMFLKLNEITAIIRMEEQTISGEAVEMADLYEPVPDFTAPRLDQIERMVGLLSGICGVRAGERREIGPRTAPRLHPDW